MKRTLTILIFLISLQVSAFAQTKIDEYERISPDKETGRVDAFLVELLDKPKAKGFFIVYSGNYNLRIGNLIPFIKGVKHQFSLRKFDTERITFVIAKGKTLFRRELWVVEQGDKKPEFEEFDFSLNDLKKKYLFASKCVECEPSQPNLSIGQIDWNSLAKTLMENPEYEVFIRLGKNSTSFDFDKDKFISAKKYVKKLRKWFSEKYKIDRKRIQYKIIEQGFAEIYIIPKKK